MTITTACVVAPDWLPRDPRGYGRIYWPAKGRQTLLHRVVMAEVYGWEALEGKVVMHLCDNPPCYRLSHLRVGTQRENNIDMWRKGRNSQRRESHYSAKLTSGQVDEIRSAMADGAYGTDLARKYGVAHSTIYRIRSGELWAA